MKVHNSLNFKMGSEENNKSLALVIKLSRSEKFEERCLRAQGYVVSHKGLKTFALEYSRRNVIFHAGGVDALVTGFRIRKRGFNRVLAGMFGPILLAIWEVRWGT